MYEECRGRRDSVQLRSAVARQPGAGGARGHDRVPGGGLRHRRVEGWACRWGTRVGRARRGRAGCSCWWWGPRWAEWVKCGCVCNGWGSRADAEVAGTRTLPRVYGVSPRKRGCTNRPRRAPEGSFTRFRLALRMNTSVRLWRYSPELEGSHQESGVRRAPGPEEKTRTLRSGSSPLVTSSLVREAARTCRFDLAAASARRVRLLRLRAAATCRAP